MKKILTLALALMLIAVMSVSVFAAETSTISGGFWSAWTPGYEVAVGETIELDMTVKGGADNWNTFFAAVVNGPTTGTVAPADEVEGYTEHVLLRADNYGWATYYNTETGATVFASDIVDANEDGDTWDDFRAAYADATVDATVERTATTMVFTYKVTGANGVTFTHTATQTFPEDLGATYVFFGCDGSEVSVTPVEAAETPVEPNAPQTGIATIALAVVAMISGAYIVSKKH